MGWLAGSLIGLYLFVLSCSDGDEGGGIQGGRCCWMDWDGMDRIRLYEYVDRYGRKRIPLPGLPG